MQEVDDDVEGLVGMVDDEVLLADGGEAVPAMVADAAGIARRVGHEFEVGPIEARELRHLVERKHAVDLEHAVGGGAERALHEALQLGRHQRFDVEPNHRSAAAAPARARPLRMRSTRRVISAAARREKVRSMMRRGSAPFSIRNATRCASVEVLPEPAPAMKAGHGARSYAAPIDRAGCRGTSLAPESRPTCRMPRRRPRDAR
jgi:hypothetical protein